MTLTCPRVDAAGSQLGGHRQQLSPLFFQQTGKTARDTKVVLFVVANQQAMHPQDILKRVGDPKNMKIYFSTNSTAVSGSENLLFNFISQPTSFNLGKYT